MKILHVITTLLTGGAEHLLVDLLPRLKEKGHQVELAVFNTDETPYYKELVASGIKVHVFAGSGNVYNPLHIFRLLILMRKFDIVHTHNTAPQLFAALCSVLCKVQLCTTEHNTSNRRRRWKWYACIDRWMYSRYKKVICISDQAETNIKEYLGKKFCENVYTIYNGMNVKRFANAEPCDELIDEYKGLHTAVMVAGFRYQKDQMTLIKAYKHLPNDYHLLLVGDGERRHELETLIAKLGLQQRVHLLGLRTDVPNVLKSAEIVVMSSHYEGLSLSNIEGMVSGNPFVGSDVDGIREVTQGYGVLFPHGDDKALAEIIEKLCTDKQYAAEVSAKCIERAKMYDIQKMVDSYNDVYLDLMHTGK